MSELDLWPDIIVAEAPPDSPKAILQHQAKLLAEKTDNRLHAKVETWSGSNRAALSKILEQHGEDAWQAAREKVAFTHAFKVIVPALDDYEYEFLRLFSGAVDLYPVWGEFEGITVPLETEQELVEWLKTSFGSPRARQIISSLLAQAA